MKSLSALLMCCGWNKDYSIAWTISILYTIANVRLFNENFSLEESKQGLTHSLYSSYSLSQSVIFYHKV